MTFDNDTSHITHLFFPPRILYLSDAWKFGSSLPYCKSSSGCLLLISSHQPWNTPATRQQRANPARCFHLSPDLITLCSLFLISSTCNRVWNFAKSEYPDCSSDRDWCSFSSSLDRLRWSCEPRVARILLRHNNCKFLQQSCVSQFITTNLDYYQLMQEIFQLRTSRNPSH